MKVEAGCFEVEAGADEKQQIKFVWPYLLLLLISFLFQRVGSEGSTSLSLHLF